LLAFAALLPAGCGSESPADDTTPAYSEVDSRFDPWRAGTIVGRVTWTGEVPQPPGFLQALVRPDGFGLTYFTAENPNRPLIDAGSRGVANAVVSLRGIDPARAKPWDLPPVQVEIGNGRIEVRQGPHQGRSGFVRVGGEISARSTEPSFHILRGRGDDFFSLTLPEAGRPTTRVLRKPGRVELSSGTGLYWARADLFVSEHPYLTRTDSQGRFRIEQVPAGPCEVVVWHPGWDPLRQERDPDSTAIVRMVYSAPLVRAESVDVPAGGVAERGFTLP
jgi:hypothetical protein